MPEYQDTYKHKGLRTHLADQLRRKGIADQAVLRAIESLPRHFFMPHEFESHAYEDKPFPIGEDQTISQPYTVAYQTQLLNLKPGDKILEIGTGSGYQGSVLSLCGAEVFSIERIAVLSEQAAATIKKVNKATGLSVKMQMFVGDGTKGLPSHAPYDGILVTAGAPSVPKALVNQLKTGGKLIIPVGKLNDVQRMVRITRTPDGGIQTEAFDDFSFVPLLGENGWKT